MTIPWETLDAATTSEGRLELRRRGEREFLITIAGRVLMNSKASLSELVLGRLACEAITKRATPRVLIGGLGMACTLRACLDVLPARARVVVVELNDVVVRWCCQGPLAELTDRAAHDPRVQLRIGDVADVIRETASPGADRFDAVILDLYEGPHPVCPRDHPHYGQQALDRAHAALRERGVFALWSEDPNPSFEKHLTRAGFTVRTNRPPHGTRRHVVYLGERGERGRSSK
jgi:spermidine synthase